MRDSRPVLGERGGETPPRHSTRPPRLFGKPCTRGILAVIRNWRFAPGDLRVSAPPRAKCNSPAVPGRVEKTGASVPVSAIITSQDEVRQLPQGRRVRVHLNRKRSKYTFTCASTAFATYSSPAYLISKIREFVRAILSKAPKA